MTISQKQHAANQANAQKSTGPRTDAGKKRASLNALKHGCSAQTIILPGEDIHHFLRFHQALKACLAPANALEESLVETLIQNQWATNRMRACETSLFALGHEQLADTVEAGGDQVIQSALAGAKVMKAELESLKTSSMYLQRNARMYDTTLRQLQSLQATRKVEEQQKIKLGVELSSYHRKAKIPFNVKDYGFDCSLQEIEFQRRRQNARDRPFTASTAA